MICLGNEYHSNAHHLPSENFKTKIYDFTDTIDSIKHDHVLRIDYRLSDETKSID